GPCGRGLRDTPRPRGRTATPPSPAGSGARLETAQLREQPDHHDPPASIGDVPRRSLLPHPARLARLFPGLVLFGVSVALMVRADLGPASWDVFHQGLSRRTGMPIGVATIVVSVAVLLLWIPLRQRPGLGTLCNALLRSEERRVGKDGRPRRWPRQQATSR